MMYLISKLTRNFKIGFLLSILIFTVTLINAQDRMLVYHLQRDGNAIGDMSIVIKDSSTIKTYFSTTNATFQIAFLSFEILDTKYVCLKNGIVYKSFVTRKSPGKAMTKLLTVLENRGYTDGYNLLTELKSVNKITFTSLQLLDNVPVGVMVVYSEFFRKFLPLKRITDDRYVLLAPDGTKYEYVYKNGVCTKVITYSRWTTITAVLDESQIAQKLKK